MEPPGEAMNHSLAKKKRGRPPKLRVSSFEVNNITPDLEFKEDTPANVNEIPMEEVKNEDINVSVT